MVNSSLGNPPVVQGLELYAVTVEGLSSTPGLGTRQSQVRELKPHKPHGQETNKQKVGER